MINHEQMSAGRFRAPVAAWGPVRDFVSLLDASGSVDVVVLGGAVRDMFLQRSPEDLDIAVRLDPGATGRAAMMTPLRLGGPQLAPAVRHALVPLATALGCTAASFLDGTVTFSGYRIELLGLNTITDSTGRALLPDIFVDRERGAIFNAADELSINQLAVGPGLVFHGDRSSIEDIHDRIARFRSGPLGLRLRGIIRALHAQRRFGLRFDHASARAVLTHLHVLAADESRLRRELDEDDTRRLIGLVFPDLHAGTFELGVLDRIGRAMTCAMN